MCDGGAGEVGTASQPTRTVIRLKSLSVAERAIVARTSVLTGPVDQQWREMMTVVRNPDHVTFAVANAATAIKFFELLGFRKQHVVTIDGGPPARYMGMPDMKAQHITLVLEDAEPSFEIQLLEFDPRPPEDPGEHPTNRRRRGYNHLAFRVDDIGTATKHLMANGVNMLSEEMDYISRRV